MTWDKVDTFPLGSKSVARNNWPTKDHVFRIYDVPPHAEIEDDQEWLFSHPLDSQVFVPLIQAIQAFVGVEEDLYFLAPYKLKKLVWWMNGSPDIGFHNLSGNESFATYDFVAHRQDQGNKRYANLMRQAFPKAMWALDGKQSD